MIDSHSPWKSAVPVLRLEDGSEALYCSLASSLYWVHVAKRDQALKQLKRYHGKSIHIHLQGRTFVLMSANCMWGWPEGHASNGGLLGGMGARLSMQGLTAACGRCMATSWAVTSCLGDRDRADHHQKGWPCVTSRMLCHHDSMMGVQQGSHHCDSRVSNASNPRSKRKQSLQVQTHQPAAQSRHPAATEHATACSDADPGHAPCCCRAHA